MTFDPTACDAKTPRGPSRDLYLFDKTEVDQPFMQTFGQQ
jgi:hypothetical protein